VLCSLGVIQSFHANAQVTTIEDSRQTIALGPVASQEAIKLLSSDGGGFFNANSAHPFENPTPLANLIEMLLMLALPAGLTFSFGRMLHDPKQARTAFRDPAAGNHRARDGADILPDPLARPDRGALHDALWYYVPVGRL
jgi:K+-transporting ATPase A subunit